MAFPLFAFVQFTWLIPLALVKVCGVTGMKKARSARDAGTAFRDDEREMSFYRMGFRKRGIRPPSTMKMEKAASMTPEMTGTCTGSASSSGLSQYMERMTLK